jgi:hypothetical protein
MVYKSGFIACCKVDGKILREDAGVVTLPFGCEYSVLLKNLNSVRAQVKVSVDGTDATEGTWLTVPANGEIELERYIRNGNFDRGNRFKFIERTAQIESNKGVGASDGLIRVEYKSEVVPAVTEETIVRRRYVDDWYPVPRPYYPHYPPYDPFWKGPTLGGQITCGNLSTTQDVSYGIGGQTVGASNQASANNSFTASSSTSSKGKSPLRSSGIQGSASRGDHQIVRSMAMNDVGITVPGSESSQKFVAGAWFKTEATSSVIVLQLRGVVAGKVVKTAVTVKSKPKCETCGLVNKSSMKFCGKCGTSLQII